MANYRSSITTRYGTTLTATNDNTSAFAGTSANLTLSNDTLTVSGDVSWNGQIGGSAQDVVMFDKTIILQDDSRLYGNGTNGAHWWLVNCNILVEDSGAFGVNDTRLAAGPASNVGNGSRNDTITGTDGDDCTFNMYNCIITFMSTDSNPNGDIVLGTAEDVEFHYLYPSGNKSDAFPQNGSDWENIVLNASTANISKQNGYQLFSAPDKFDGIQLINFWGYTGSDSASGGIEVTYDGFSAVNNFNPSDNDQDAFTIYEVAGFGEVGPYGTCTNMVSPKSDLTPDGAVRWRRLAGNASRPDEHLDHSIILRQDIRRRFVDGDDDGRNDVRMYFNTNVELTQKAGVTSPPDDTDDLPSKSYLFYNTNEDGHMTGTYDFNTGNTVTSQVWGTSQAPIRLPLQWLRTGDETNNDNQYTNSVYSFESDITEFSLWGTMYNTFTRNQNQVRSTADSNGFFISPDDSGDVVDVDDSMMAEYDNTIATLTGKFTAATGSISWNDVGAIYKYAAWNRTIPLDNWSSTKLTGTSLDVSGSTVNKLLLGNGTDAVQISGTDTLHVDAPVSSSTITVNYSTADHVDTVNFDDITASGAVISQPSNTARYETGILSLSSDFTGLSATPSYDSLGGPTSNTIDGGTTDWENVWGISLNGTLPASGFINLYDDASNYVVCAFTRVNNGSAVDTIQFGTISAEAGNFHPADEEQWHYETASTLDGLSSYSEDGGSFRIDGGDVNVDTMSKLHSYTSAPSEPSSNFSIKNAKVTGSSGDSCTIDLDTDGGFYVFHDLERDSDITFTASDSSHSYTVLATGETNANNLTTSASNVSIQSIVEITLDGGTGHTASNDNVGSAVFRLGSSVSDAEDNGTLTTVSSDNITVDGSTYTFRFEVPKGDSVYAAIAINGFEIEAFTGVGNTERDLTSITNARLSFDVSDFNVWGDVTVAESEVTVTTPTGNANADAITVLINKTGNSVGPTQATNTKFRRFFREYVQQNNGWMDGVLLGYIAGDFISWQNDTIVVADNQNERLKLNRTSDLNSSWRVGTVITDESGNDLFDVSTTGTAGQQIYFTPNPTGASISQIQAIIDTHEASVKGSADRDLTETYNQAKGAKNAAYAAG